MWPNNRLADLFGIELPILQAPMAGANGSAMAAAVSEAGGLGSLPCAMLAPDRVPAEIGVIRQRTSKPFNVNFFCHKPVQPDPAAESAWRKRLAPYYEEFGLDPDADAPSVNRAPFDEAACEIVEELKPPIVSFHFGLPDADLVKRVEAAGCLVMGSATTSAEARWLEDNGCDAIIAQGYEAGGHRGMFKSENPSNQAGTMALVPQVVDAIGIPVIAAGGIADGRGVAAAFALGASGVQIGTAFLLTPQSLVSALHRNALETAGESDTALTNIFSGRPARGILNRVMREAGPISPDAPAFPTASGALAPIKQAAEERGSADFSSLWAGQGVGLVREMDAGELTSAIAREAREIMRSLT